MKFLENILEKMHPLFAKGGKLEMFYPLFEAGDTFAFTTSETTKGRTHVRDHFDMKRLMISVVIALTPPLIMGFYNTGYQALVAQGIDPSLTACLFKGLLTVLPIIITSYAVGGFWEVIFAVVRKHEINEGFLVTGLLLPLTLPPTIPLWQVAIAMSFGIVIGKEVFGGTGMNILNPALTARAFIFFAYPASISGDRVWTAIDVAKDKLIDGYSGATPLLSYANAEIGTSVQQVVEHTGFTWTQMFFGLIPGSIGETSALACLLGAAFLIITGIGSWRIMMGMTLGGLVVSLLFNLMAGPNNIPFMMVPFHYHFVMGGFAFGLVYMATDPVSATYTQLGKWIYGFLIGVLAILIRVVNPAYPEGVMLAILFMNIFSSLIDHYVVEANISRRIKVNATK